MQRIIDKICKR